MSFLKMETVNISVVSGAVMTLLFMVLVGYFIRKINFINDTASKQLSTLVINVGQPFMFFGALLKNEYSPELLKKGLLIIVVGLAVHVILAALAFVFSKCWRDQNERKILEFSMIFANCAFIGFPILEAAFGSKGLFYGSFYVISFNIFMWSYGMVILGRGRNDIKVSPVKMVLNYGTTPCLIGLALYIWQLKPPTFIMSGASYIGSICTPLSTFVIGSLLASMPIKEIFNNVKIYLFSFFKLIVMPMVVVLIAKLVGLDSEMIYIAAIMSALPTAANTAMFAEVYDIKPKLAAHAVGMSSLLSPIAVPIVLFLTRLVIGE